MSFSDSEESEESDMIPEEVAKRAPEVISLSDSEESEGSDMIREEVAKRTPEIISLSDSEGSEERESDEEKEENENEDSLARNKSKKRGASSLSPPHPSSSRKKKKGKNVSRRHAVTHLEKQKATNIEGNEKSESDEEEEEDENEDDDTDDCLAGKKIKKKGDSSLSPPHLSSSRKQMRGKCVLRRHAVTNLEKQKALEAAFSFTSKNPHCMKHMTANLVYRWSLMRFPTHFSNNHLPHEKTKCILKNSAGKEWIGSYTMESKRSSRCVISCGWTDFARDNHLEEDDYCVFELVNNTHLEFLVHIFRVVEKVVPK